MTDNQEFNEAVEVEGAKAVAIQLTNDFTAEDKDRIRAEVVSAVDEILEQPSLTINSLSHLAMVSHGSIKSRAKSTQSAREIVLGVFDGTRASRAPAVNATSVKSFLASLSEEEKAAMLAELGV